MRWPSTERGPGGDAGLTGAGDGWSRIGTAVVGAFLGGWSAGSSSSAVTLVLKAGMDFGAGQNLPYVVVVPLLGLALATLVLHGYGRARDGRTAAAESLANIPARRRPRGHQQRRRGHRRPRGAVPLAPGADPYARDRRHRRARAGRWGPRRRPRIWASPPVAASAIAVAGGADCFGPPRSRAARPAWPR